MTLGSFRVISRGGERTRVPGVGFRIQAREFKVEERTEVVRG